MHVRPGHVTDAEALRGRLRAADQAEARAHGWEPDEALMASARSADQLYAIVADDLVVGLFGTSPHPTHPEAGLVWLVGSEEMTCGRNALRFLRESRQWVETLHQKYLVLCNLVDVRNTLHLRWIRWCGFTFVNRLYPYGPEGREFYEFVKVGSCAMELVKR